MKFRLMPIQGLCVTLLLFATNCFSQSDSLWINFDGDGRQVAISYIHSDTLPQNFQIAVFTNHPEVVAVSRSINSSGDCHGLEKIYYPNGKKYRLYTYSNGVKDGEFEVYSMTGYLSQRGTMKNDVKHGKVDLYLDGAYWTTEIYKNGVLVKDKKKGPKKKR